MARHQFFDEDLTAQEVFSREFLLTTVRVCQGTVDLVTYDEGKGPLWTGEGERSCSVFVPFDVSFSAPPVVHASLALFDFHCATNQRLSLRVRGIDEHGFVAELRTWGDTRVARTSITWMAFGAGIEALRPVVPTRPPRAPASHRVIDLPTPPHPVSPRA